MGNLVGISCGEKDPLGRIALRGKNVPLARDVTERFTTGKMECKKEKTHVYIKLDIENPIIRINTAFKGCSSLEKM